MSFPPHATLDKAHWPLWKTYFRASEEARELALVLGHPVVFRRWGSGWVIWNYRNLNRDRWNQVTRDIAEDERRQEQHDSYSWRDNYSDEEYTRRDLAAESDGYVRYAGSYD